MRRPVLAAVSVLSAAAASLLAGTAPAHAGPCAGRADWPALDGSRAQQVVVLVNAHRRALGLRPLRTARPLDAAATWKARHMARFRYMSHDDRGRRTPGTRLRDCGYGRAGGWAENIAFGQRSPRAVVAAWLRSPGHRANIENPSFRATGVGIAVARTGAPYWAQTFGTSARGRG